MAVTVRPFIAPASPTTSLLMSTLAFETIVDAVLAFHVRAGVLSSHVITAQTRQQYRAMVAEMLNGANEHVVASVSGDADLKGCSFEYALGLYRARLRSMPVAGVGEMR